MNALASFIEKCWLWTFTAGMPPEEAHARRWEIQSDWSEYARFAAERPRLAGGRLRRLFTGAPDDIAWRASLGRGGLSVVPSHETVLLVALLGLVFLSIPVSAWGLFRWQGIPTNPVGRFPARCCGIRHSRTGLLQAMETNRPTAA